MFLRLENLNFPHKPFPQDIGEHKETVRSTMQLKRRKPWGNAFTLLQRNQSDRNLIFLMDFDSVFCKFRNRFLWKIIWFQRLSGEQIFIYLWHPVASSQASIESHPSYACSHIFYMPACQIKTLKHLIPCGGVNQNWKNVYYVCAWNLNKNLLASMSKAKFLAIGCREFHTKCFPSQQSRRDWISIAS